MIQKYESCQDLSNFVSSLFSKDFKFCTFQDFCRPPRWKTIPSEILTIILVKPMFQPNFCHAGQYLIRPSHKSRHSLFHVSAFCILCKTTRKTWIQIQKTIRLVQCDPNLLWIISLILWKCISYKTQVCCHLLVHFVQ